MSDAIACRIFRVDEQDVPCRFFRPEEEEGSYFCRFEIAWPEDARVRKIGGVDQVQALLLAMQCAHSELLAARNMDGHRVEWLNGKDLGLPVAKVMRDWAEDGL
jgi:hypothetical protein